MGEEELDRLIVGGESTAVHGLVKSKRVSGSEFQHLQDVETLLLYKGRVLLLYLIVEKAIEVFIL